MDVATSKPTKVWDQADQVKQYDLLVFIGRFQPFHLGHGEHIQQALRKAERVLILIGSSNRARTPRNPWTYHEREKMFRSLYPWEMANNRITVKPLVDYVYNETAWMTKVREIIQKEVADMWITFSAARIGLVGFEKDHSSYYLKIFGEFSFVDKEIPYPLFNSTDIRDEYFTASPKLPEIVPPQVKKFMTDFVGTKEWQFLTQENLFNKQYKESWKLAPWPVTITTVDPVVVQSGHILLITRKEFPGKGMLAFPGGHLNPNERLVDAVVRELKEETEISDEKGKIPPARLKSFIQKVETFDDPHRSERARVITHAYLFKCPDMQTKYYVGGHSDAEKADWYPINEVKSTMMFEDHYFIMCKLLGLTIE